VDGGSELESPRFVGSERDVRRLDARLECHRLLADLEFGRVLTRIFATELAARNDDVHRPPLQPALPQLNEDAAAFGFFHLRVGLQVDGKIDSFRDTDADRENRYAEPRYRRILTAAQRRDAAVLSEVAEHHDAGEPSRTKLLANFTDDGAEGGHLPLRGELFGEMLGIELVSTAGIEGKLAKLARGVSVEEERFKLDLLIVLKL